MMNSLSAVAKGVSLLLKETAAFLQKPPGTGDAPPDPVPETRPEAPVKSTTSQKPEAIAELDQSVDNMRATAKWIITILAAMATAVLAGTQLTSFGNLRAPDPLEDARLGIAWLAGTVALSAIGCIIWQATKVLTVGNATLSDLAAHEDDQPPHENVVYVKKIGVLDGAYDGELAETITEFQEKRTRYQKDDEGAREALFQAKIAAQRDPNNTILEGAVEIAKLQAGATAAKRLSLSSRRRVLLAALRAEIIGRTMAKAAKPMVIGGVIGGISLGMFVWAINPPAPDDDLPFVIPAHGYVRLSEENQSQWEKELGEQCVANPIQVMVLSISEENAEVVSVAGTGCAAARFTVSLDEVYPGQRVIVPTPEVTPDG